MRNTEKRESMQGIVLTDSLFTKKIAKTNFLITKTYDYSEFNSKLKDAVHLWICSDLIECLPTLAREKTSRFLIEFESLITDVYNENNSENISYCNLYNLFFAKLSFKDCKIIINDLKEVLINSKIADDLSERSDRYLFLSVLNDFIHQIKKIQKESFQLALIETVRNKQE